MVRSGGGEGGTSQGEARDEGAPEPIAFRPRGRPRPAAEVLLENLLTVVKANGLSQAELARRARTPLSTINRVFHWRENGVAVSLDTIERIARGLQVPVAVLLTENGSSQLPPPSIASGPVSRLRGRHIARQLGRLTEDFLQCSEEGRVEVLRVAEDWAGRADQFPESQGKA